MSGTIPIYTTDKIPWKSKEGNNPDITLFVRPFGGYVRTKIDDMITELKKGVTKLDVQKATEEEAKDLWKVLAGTGMWWLIRFGLAGWDWQHNGQPVEFRTKLITKWGKDYEVASEESVDLLYRSAPKLFREFGTDLMNEEYLTEEEEKNSSSPSPAPSMD